MSNYCKLAPEVPLPCRSVYYLYATSSNLAGFQAYASTPFQAIDSYWGEPEPVASVTNPGAASAYPTVALSVPRISAESGSYVLSYYEGTFSPAPLPSEPNMTVNSSVAILPLPVSKYLDFNFSFPVTSYDSLPADYQDIARGYGDFDDDGILNKDDADIDGDGVPNEVEYHYGSNPYDEYDYPSDKDTDKDGFSDLVENYYGTNPNDVSSTPDNVDSDGDGTPNYRDPSPNGAVGAGGSGGDSGSSEGDSDNDGDSSDSSDGSGSGNGEMDESDDGVGGSCSGVSSNLLSSLAGGFISVLPSSPESIRIPSIIESYFGQGTLGAALILEIYSGVWQLLLIVAFVKFYKLMPGKFT